jgi:K+-sensing histidine kinase KdpD
MLKDESIIPHKHGEWPYRRSPTLRYAVAVLAVLAAFSVRHVIYGDLQSRLAFTFFVPAAIVAVWYGGLGPGALATVLGMMLGEYFFMMARGAVLWPLGVREGMSLGVFGVTTMMCVMLCENLHRTIRRLEALLTGVRHAWQMSGDTPAFDPAALEMRGGYLQRSLAQRYGLTALAVVGAFALRYWLFGTHETRFPFIFFVPAAMIAAWYGGLGPGLLATAAGLVLGDYFFLSQHEALGAVGDIERLSIGLYAVSSTMCVLLFEVLHDHILRLEHAIERAEQHSHGVHLQLMDAAPAAGG